MLNRSTTGWFNTSPNSGVKPGVVERFNTGLRQTMAPDTMTAAASQAARRRCRRCCQRLEGRALNDLLQTVPGWNEITQQFRQQSSKIKVHSN